MLRLLTPAARRLFVLSSTITTGAAISRFVIFFGFSIIFLPFQSEKSSLKNKDGI